MRGERANFTRLVLGCIEAKFCKNMRWKALAEIYILHSFAPFWNLKSFVKKVLNFFLISIILIKFSQIILLNFD